MSASETSAVLEGIPKAGRDGTAARSSHPSSAFGIAVAAIGSCFVVAQLANLTRFGGVGVTEWVVVAGGISALVLATRLSVHRWTSPVVLWLGAFLLFHLPIALFSVLSLPFPLRRHRQLAIWMEPAGYRAALWLVLLAALAYLAGAASAAVVTRKRSHRVPGIRTLLPDSQALAVSGAILMVIAVLSWGFLIETSIGFGRLIGQYRGYVEYTRTLPIGVPTTLIGFALCITAAGGAGPWRRMSIGIFAIWAALALPLGLRGEVLFPLVAATAVWTRRREPGTRPRRNTLLLLACCVLLPLLTLFGQIRNTTTLNSDWGAKLDPADVMIEMGTTLRAPLQAMHYEWSGASMSSLKMVSDTAWYTLGHIGLDAPERSPRIGLVLNRQAIGKSGIGSSPVAETYLSGGTLFLAAFFFVAGVGLCWLDRSAEGARQSAFVGMMLLPLITSVRNEFVFVPYQMAAALLLLALLAAFRWPLARLARRIL